MTENTPYAGPRPATAADRPVVSDILIEAFMDDPVARWLFPTPDERRRLQSHFYGQLLERENAEAYLVGRAGAAVWLALTAGQAPDDDPTLTTAFGDSGPRLRTYGQALAERHPGDEPHLYLACMGVVSGRQGTGLGSALLRDGLERADGRPAYLEASSPRSRALYLRHGFEDLGEPIQVADGPPVWPMWRPQGLRP